MLRQYLKNRLTLLVKSPQFLAFLLYTLVNCGRAMIPLRQMCADIGFRISWAYFPIFIVSSFYRQLLLGAVILFSDVPFIRAITPYELIRGRRHTLLIANSLYIMLLSFFYIFLLFLITLLMIVPYVSFIPDWGKVINSLYLGDLNLRYLEIGFFHENRMLFYQFTPAALLWRGILMNFLQYSMLGMVMQAIALYFPKSRYAHGVFAVAYIFLPQVARAFGDKSWLAYLPASWFELVRLNLRGSMNALTPTLTVAWSFLALVGLLAFGLSFIPIHRHDIYDYIGESK